METALPHLTFEYSANLDAVIDMNRLCAVVRRAMLDTGLFEIGAVRVRALRAEAYAIADEMKENSFIDATLRIGAGRSSEDKARAGEVIFAAISAHLETLFKTPHFALSFEIREIDPDLSWKKNAIHPRLRGK
jgi:5-carboxymethyl-2-hydroxymuconate isomerase